MAGPVIKIENLSKHYRLGTWGTGTLSHDLNRYWALLRGKPDPSLKIPLSREQALAGESVVKALDDVCLEVELGSVLGIIGNNGAGKSTLLKIISKITLPTEGSILIRGKVSSLLEVGTGFHPELTGRENVFLNGCILGMQKTDIQAVFDEIVAFSGLEKHIDTPIKRYSSGMYVRLAFAVAAHLEKDILLVDEVLALGDSEFQQRCLGKISDVARQGRTVLYVSHQLASVQALADRVIVLGEGRIIADGKPEETTEAYLQKVTVDALEWHLDTDPGKEVFIRSVRLLDHALDPVSRVTTGSSIAVEVRFKIEKYYTDLQLSVGLLDFAGGRIFFSSPQDADVSSPSGTGEYLAIVYRPPEIFMPAGYQIKAVLWLPAGGVVDGNDKIRFQAIDTPSLHNSTPGGRGGLIALRCRWQMNKTPD